MHALSRTLPAVLALLVACAEGANRADAPLDRVHYPAGAALSEGQLLVANADQDLAYEGGSLLAFDPETGEIEGGVALPYMAGRLRVVDEEAAEGCEFGAGFPYLVPFAMVPGRSEESLHVVRLPLAPGTQDPRRRIDLRADGAAYPYEAALTCGADGTPRAWVSFQRGLDDRGYVAQLDLSGATFPPPVVQVFTGLGAPRNFAWDRDQDRLYFTTREFRLRAPIRWIGIGDGCEPFDGGVQDERRGGCHVDQQGIDLSAHLVGAEPNGIALSSGERPCVYGEAGDVCRRMYVTVQLYDADLARYLDGRPSGDVGGKLVVLELFESGLGGPAVRWIDDVDIGKVAGDVLVIRRPPLGDLVVTTAVHDDLLWIYDDERGGVAKVFGRLATGVPEVGHKPTGLASLDMGNGTVRVFVTSYEDHWVTAVDIPLADPTQARVAVDGGAAPLRFGRPQ
ncbi:MAG TPA: hypothetical protein VEB43_08840 [Anaeromyxobacter sp.]|nr:hypothetical protein [Anaeromyxobacter sp.]